jgi:hypothetical protein
MYPIDFNTATMADVIERSITCHPSLLADSMRAVAKIHRDYVGQTHDRDAKASAGRMAQNAEFAARMIEANAPDELVKVFSAKIQTFEQACRLQLVPRATVADIAAREEGSV